MHARFLAGLVLASAALAPVAVPADVTINIGVPPPPAIVLPAPPTLVVVPGYPTVRYAPSLQVDLFFHGNLWYYSHGGFWYAGPSWRGPWHHVVVEKLPPAIVVVPVKFYRIPPGHLKKAGPPGRAGGPPGHAKGKGKGKN